MIKGYLTIDDAPSKEFKQKIDFLISKRIPAILFCEGRFLKKRSKLAIYAIKNGFIIGNHSYDHPRFPKLSLEQCKKQIIKTDKIIEKIYEKAKIKRPFKVFRFPYGGEKTGIRKFLKEIGYQKPMSWYLDCMEWAINGDYTPKIKTITDVFNRIDKHKYKTTEVILVHDHLETTKYFAPIINKLLSKGLKFKKFRI